MLLIKDGEEKLNNEEVEGKGKTWKERVTGRGV